MICSNCKMRWADFPKDDFTIDTKGIHAKSKAAEKRRVAKFDSNEIQYCGCIERDNEINEIMGR